MAKSHTSSPHLFTVTQIVDSIGCTRRIVDDTIRTRRIKATFVAGIVRLYDAVTAEQIRQIVNQRRRHRPAEVTCAA